MNNITKAGFLSIAISLSLLGQAGPGGGPRFGSPRSFDGFGPAGAAGAPMGGPRGGPGGMMGVIGAGPARSSVTGAPYSATETLQTQQTLADGNQISRKQVATVYRDGQGRIRTEETLSAPPRAANQGTRTVVTIFDPVAGYRYVLDSSSMTANQMPLPPQRSSAATQQRPNRQPLPMGMASPNGNAPGLATASLGIQVINGVAATGTQVTEVIPAGAIGNAQPMQVTRTTWISNELQVPVQIRTSDPRFGTTDMELTNIVQAEPSPSLFVVPAGYTLKTGRGPGGNGPGPDRMPGRNGNARRGGPNPQ